MSLGREPGPSDRSDQAPSAGGPDGDHEPPGPGGRIRGTSPGALVVFAVVGLVGGWAWRRVSMVRGEAPPTVGWLPVLALTFVAVVMAGVAWSTYRSLHRRGERLAPHHAVNRLVLAKACALAGALVAAGYFGYALSWVGVGDGLLIKERIVRSLVGGFSGVGLVVASLLLERACRVRRPRS